MSGARPPLSEPDRFPRVDPAADASRTAAPAGGGSAALVPQGARRLLAITVAVAVVVVAALAAVVWHGTTTGVDSAALRALDAHVGGRTGLALLDTTSPQISVFLLALVVLVAGAARRWDVLVLAVVGPSVALVVTEWVLKPVVDRRFVLGALHGAVPASAPAAFPSGHETGVASTALVLLLAVRLVPLSRAARATSTVVLGGWTLLAGVGLVRRHWHYLTDVVAALGVSTAVVLGLALMLAAGYGRLSSPAGRSRPSTSRGA